MEQQLLGGGLSSMSGDQKWQNRLAQAEEDGIWGVLDVYSDELADGALSMWHTSSVSRVRLAGGRH